jgi:hypothetical protein
VRAKEKKKIPHITERYKGKNSENKLIVENHSFQRDIQTERLRGS